MRQARAEFGLSQHAIYMAIDRGQLDPLQVDGKGRVYYSEVQLRAVTNSYHLAAA